MSYNHKEKSGKKYPVQIHGKVLQLSEGQIGELIKKRLRNDVAVVKMFRKFELDIDNQLNDLKVHIKPLDGEFARTDEDLLVISDSLFKDTTDDWLEKNYFIFVHEIWHYILRNFEEQNGFFGDFEEIEGFILSVASLLAQKKSLDEIFNKVFPKINFHFHNPEKAQSFFFKLIAKAKELLNN